MSIKYLYKYREFNKFSIQIISKRELYFSRFEDLNDPYEISLPVTFEGTDEEVKNKLKSLGIPLTDKNLMDAKDPNSQIRKDLLKQAEKNLEIAKKTFGICSFSEVNNDILLWSNYADCHRGFCLEFDVETDFFNNKKTGELLFHNVKYPIKIPSNSYFKNTPKESMFATLLNKYHGWSYEKEWRLLGTPGCHIFEPHCLKGVIFGYRMPKHKRNFITALLKSWITPVNCYEIKLNTKADFGLKTEKIY